MTGRSLPAGPGTVKERAVSSPSQLRPTPNKFRTASSMPFLSGKLFSGKRSPGSPPARGAIGSAAVLALLLLATAPPGAWAEGAPAVKDWMPPDLSADEQREWK